MKSDKQELVIQIKLGCTGLAVSASLCYLSAWLANLLKLPGALIPIVTALTVTLASVFPKTLEPLVCSSEGIAVILLQVG